MAADGTLRKDPRGERPGVERDALAARAIHHALGATIVTLGWTCTGESGTALYWARLADDRVVDVELAPDGTAVVYPGTIVDISLRFVCSCGAVLASEVESTGAARAEPTELSPLSGVRPAGAFVACSDCLGPDTVRVG